MSDVKPILNANDYENALAEIERLWGSALGTPEGNRLDVLATLVEAYETKHYPIDTPDPIEAILARLEQLGLTRKDLEPILGGRGRVSEVLNRHRGLSLEMIRRLSEILRMPADLLIAPVKRTGWTVAVQGHKSSSKVFKSKAEAGRLASKAVELRASQEVKAVAASALTEAHLSSKRGAKVGSFAGKAMTSKSRARVGPTVNKKK